MAGGEQMICPYCKEEMREDERGYYVCGKCLGEFWPKEKPERGPYKKSINVEVSISSPALMLWHEEDMNYKPPLPPGEPCFKGGSKSGKKRKKPAKRDIRIVYET
jgi:hypothetical protein